MLAPLLAVLAIGAANPAAAAGQAAIDQYTEQPPAGAGGPQGSIDTEGGGSPQPQAPSPGPAPQAAGGAPAAGDAQRPSAGPPPPPPAKNAERSAGKRSGPGAENKPDRRPQRVAPVRSVGEEELPLFGYPTTALVSVLAALVLAALAVRLGLAVQRRRSTATS